MSIVIQRNRILLSGLIEERLERFKQNFSIMDFAEDLSMQVKWNFYKVVNYKDKEYYSIPRNTPLKYFINFLEKEERYTENDMSYNTVRKIDLQLKEEFKPRNSLQEEILDFLEGINSFSEIKTKPRRALFVDTGEGKTFLTITDISKIKEATVILCPDTRAIKTWKEEFSKFTNLTEEDIAVVSGFDNFKKFAYSDKKFPIYLLSLKTVTSIVDNKEDQMITDFFENNGIGIKVLDEMHMMLKSHYCVEMLTSTKKTIYLTATDSRRLFKENFVIQYMTPSSSCVYRQEKVKKFDYIQVNYYSHASKEQQKGVKGFTGFNASKYINMIVNYSELQNDFVEKFLKPTIKNALSKKSKPEFKIGLLFKTKESGKIFGEMLESFYPDLTIGYFNGSISESEKEKEVLKDIIISTDRSFAGIINIKGLEIIINTIPSRTESNLLQIMGRLRNEEGKKRIFYQYVDLSVPCLRNISNSMRNIIEEVSVSMTKVTLNKNEED